MLNFEIVFISAAVEGRAFARHVKVLEEGADSGGLIVWVLGNHAGDVLQSKKEKKNYYEVRLEEKERLQFYQCHKIHVTFVLFLT